jgi:phytanoyl-CoA dioxygenase PhyH
MTPLRTNENMIRDGVLTHPFPAELSDMMIRHMRRYIAKATGVAVSDKADCAELTAAVSTLSDEAFIQKFSKPLRMFPDAIGGAVCRWVEDFGELLGGTRSGINYISKLEQNGNPALTSTSFDVFWRCVRPGKPDIGQPHADFQFWELNRGTLLDPPSPFDYDERWKIWLPLMGCDPANSLEVIAGSHREEIPVERIQTTFGPRPSIRADWIAANQHRFFCPLPKFEHCCVLFHDRTVHRGAPNNASGLRLSGELTILLKL